MTHSGGGHVRESVPDGGATNTAGGGHQWEATSGSDDLGARGVFQDSRGSDNRAPAGDHVGLRYGPSTGG